MLTYPVSNMQSPVAAPLIINLPSLINRWRSDSGVINTSDLPASNGEDVKKWIPMVGSGDLNVNTGYGSVYYDFNTNQQNGHALLETPGGSHAHGMEAAGIGNAKTMFAVGGVPHPGRNFVGGSNTGAAAITTGTNGAVTLLRSAGESHETTEQGLFSGPAKLYVGRFSTTQNAVRVNGVAQTIANFSVAPNASPSLFYMGNHAGSTAPNWIFGEILLYNEELTDSQILDIEAELNDFWALY